MAEFSVFFRDILLAVANFLWLDATRWITGMLILLMLLSVFKRIIKI